MKHNILILFYNTMFGVPLEYSSHELPTGCCITTDRSLFHQADAVIFHIPDLRRTLGTNEEIEKQEGQFWVAWNLECEVNYPWTLNSEFRNTFDLWMGYHDKDDIIYNYCKYEYLDKLKNSFVDVQPYPKQLALFINHCYENESLYSQFFEWRKYSLCQEFKDRIDRERFNPFIRLCTKIKELKQNNRMNAYCSIITTVFLLIISTTIYSQENRRQITVDEVVNILSLESTPAKIQKLNFQNEQLLFENYKKGFLPSLALNVNPINFNRSLRMLQQPTDGSYSYVEDYSNNSSWGITIRQKVGLTGGELNVGSRLNYLNEFSQKRSSFSTSPFTIGYSQQLWGGGKTHRYERNIEYAKNEVAIKNYCSKLSEIQQEALNLFMTALLSKLEYELEHHNKEINDTLLSIARTKLDNGNITEFDFKQIELESLNTQYAYENAMRSHEEALQRLKTYLIIEEGLQITIPEFNLPLSIDIQTAFSYVKKNNPFSMVQQIAKLEAEKVLYSVKLSNRFNGNISLNYGINQYAENFVEAYRHGNTQQSVILGFQIPIFQWGINRNKIRIAKNNYAASQLNQENSQREFDNQIGEKVNNYNRSVKLWIIAERAYKLSQEQYRMLVRKFALGKISVYELTSARRDQNTTMQQYYVTIKDVYREFFSLRHMALYDFKSEKELEYIFLKD